MPSATPKGSCAAGGGLRGASHAHVSSFDGRRRSGATTAPVASSFEMLATPSSASCGAAPRVRDHPRLRGPPRDHPDLGASAAADGHAVVLRTGLRSQRSDRDAEPLEAPVRDASGKRRGDDVVEASARRGTGHGMERVVVADETLDAAAGRLLQQRDRQLQRYRRLLGVGIPERSRASRVKRHRLSAAHARTRSSSGGLAAVRWATTRTLVGAGSSDTPFVVLLAATGSRSRRRGEMYARSEDPCGAGLVISASERRLPRRSARRRWFARACQERAGS